MPRRATLLSLVAVLVCIGFCSAAFAETDMWGYDPYWGDALQTGSTYSWMFGWRTGTSQFSQIDVHWQSGDLFEVPVLSDLTKPNWTVADWNTETLAVAQGDPVTKMGLWVSLTDPPASSSFSDTFDVVLWNQQKQLVGVYKGKLQGTWDDGDHTEWTLTKACLTGIKDPGYGSQGPATPEPASFLLLGAIGLGAGAFRKATKRR